MTITLTSTELRNIVREAVREEISPWLSMDDMMARCGVKTTHTILAMERRGEIPKRNAMLGLWDRASVNDFEHAKHKCSDITPSSTIETGLIDEPGFHLYRHFNKAGTLLYVGVSLSALSRLGQHKQSAHWFAEISRVEVVNYISREQSMIAERIAIRDEKPLHNIAHNMRLVA